MTIAYEIGRSLYLNITNECGNDCIFCIRNYGESVGGNESLWLAHEPTIAEIMSAIDAHDLTQYDEVVFCGYGEPMARPMIVAMVSKHIKDHCSIKIRLNTNGLPTNEEGVDVLSPLIGYVDTISISLNAPNEKRYNEVSKPLQPNGAFDAMLLFSQKAKDYGFETLFTVVDVISEKEIEECHKLAHDMGIPLRVRHNDSE